ncbi:hypothetical protein Tco_0843793 [Tanacetum coccineum]
MDWLSKRKFVIVCHEKVVRIPLECNEILRVYGARTQGVVKRLMNTKVGESKLSDISIVQDFTDVFSEDLLGLPPQRKVKFRIDLVHGATPVAKSPYRLEPSEMQELSRQLQELQDKGGGSSYLVIMSVRFATILVRQMVADALSRKERVKPRRVRAMAMTIQSGTDQVISIIAIQVDFKAMGKLARIYIDEIIARNEFLVTIQSDEMDDLPHGFRRRYRILGDALSRKERVKSRRVRGMILAAQSEAFKQENVLAERLHGLDQQMERKGDNSLYFMDRIWVLLVGSVMDKAHASRYLEWNSGDDQLRLRRMIYLVVLADAAESVRDAIGFDYHSSIQCAPFEALYGRKCRSPVLWAVIGESSLTRLELVQEMTNKVVLVKEKPKAARDRQKSYVDYRRKP